MENRKWKAGRRNVARCSSVVERNASEEWKIEDGKREYRCGESLFEIKLFIVVQTGNVCCKMKKNLPIKISVAETRVLRELGLQLIISSSNTYNIKMLVLQTGMNRNKLVYGFKMVHGASIRQYLIRTRMKMAQQLLAANEKPIKEISSLSGYKSTANFITAFKKYYAVTPQQFQRSISL